MNAKDVASTIRLRAVELGMRTDEQIAEAAGMKGYTVRRRLKDPGSMTLDELSQIAKALRIQEAELLWSRRKQHACK